jgi:Ca2+-transporting ATPase
MELFWINLVTDIFPSIGLALEPPAADVLEQPPRSRNEPLIDSAYYRQLAKEATVIGSTSLAAHFYGIARHGTGPRTRSVTFFSLVAAQLLHTATCRRDRFHPASTPPLGNNPGLVTALIGSAALQALPIFVPPLRRLLGIGPIDPLDLAVIAATSATSYLLNERLTRGNPTVEPLPPPIFPTSNEVDQDA